MLARASLDSKAPSAAPSGMGDGGDALSYVQRLRRSRATVWCDHDKRVTVGEGAAGLSHSSSRKTQRSASATARRSKAISRVLYSSTGGGLAVRSTAPQHASLRPRLLAEESRDDDESDSESPVHRRSDSLTSPHNYSAKSSLDFGEQQMGSGGGSSRHARTSSSIRMTSMTAVSDNTSYSSEAPGASVPDAGSTGRQEAFDFDFYPDTKYQSSQRGWHNDGFDIQHPTTDNSDLIGDGIALPTNYVPAYMVSDSSDDDRNGNGADRDASTLGEGGHGRKLMIVNGSADVSSSDDEN